MKATLTVRNNGVQCVQDSSPSFPISGALPKSKTVAVAVMGPLTEKCPPVHPTLQTTVTLNQSKKRKPSRHSTGSCGGKKGEGNKRDSTASAAGDGAGREENKIPSIDQKRGAGLFVLESKQTPPAYFGSRVASLLFSLARPIARHAIPALCAAVSERV